MSKRISGHIRSNVVGYVAIFFAMSGGAYALSGSNTVFSDDIVNDQVRSVDVRDDDLAGGGLGATDLRAGSVRSSEVANGSLVGSDIQSESLTGAQVLDGTLTGDDVNEGSLGQVPAAFAATLGGLGRSGSAGSDFSLSCDPESATFLTCGSVNLPLPAQTRVLLIGQIHPLTESGAHDGVGSCRLATSATGGLTPTQTSFVTTESDNLRGSDNTTLVGITPLLGPGALSFRIECNQGNEGAIKYQQSEIVALAISAK